MIGQLTINERQSALVILLFIVLWGLLMAIAGHCDLLGPQARTFRHT